MVHIKHLKKGDILMKEGDTSTHMFWVQSGTLRLFKKKGNGFVELGVVHSGEVVGDMSFLDNQPRSASVEALQPCDIVEIPRGKFDEYIAQQPTWMTSLIQTLVKRLRSTNNRLRELESASTVYTKDEDGKTTKTHEFLSSQEILKLCSALLLVCSRNGEKQADGSTKVKAGWLQLFGGQIFNIHLSKVQVFTDTMHEAKAIRIEKNKDQVDLIVPQVDVIEKFIYWMHEENSKTDDKQLPLTAKGMEILDAVSEFGGLFQLPENTENHTVDINQVMQKSAAAKNMKIPFDLAAFPELVKSGFSQDVRAAGEEKSAVFSVQRFVKLYPLLAIRQRFRDMNAAKRS